MKKFLFILCACLFGALSGVKAWTSAYPEAGKAYYLLNVEQNQFFMAVAEGHPFYITSDLAKATPVVAESGWKFRFYVNGTAYKLYHRDGTAERNSDGMNFSFHNDDNTETGFQIHTGTKSGGDDRRWLYVTEANGQCYFPKTGDKSGDIHWKFVPVEEVLVEYGWEKVTSIESLKNQPENYLYAILSANNSSLIVRTEASTGHGYYRSMCAPLSSSEYLFSIENYIYDSKDYFVMKAENTNAYYHAENNAAYDLVAKNQPTVDSDCRLEFEYADNAWNIKTWTSYSGDANSGSYWGLWTPGEGYYDGKKMAGNKNDDQKGSFLIYRIPKANLDMTSRVTNPTFDIVKDGWSATGAFQNNQIANNKQGDFTGNFWENWNPSAKENKMYQNLTNMPNGIYKVKIAAFVSILATNNSSQYVFANSDKTYLDTTDPKFYEVCTAVTDNTLSIGLEQTTATADWMGIDNVSLTYLGGMEDLTAVSGKMNVDVNTAQQNAVNAYNSNKTAANYIAATEAIAAAEVSVAAYAKGKSALDKAGEILENTNVYTNEAYAAFAYEASLGKYNDGTWTNEEAENYNSTVFGTGWHTDANIANLLISAWDAPKTGDDRWGTYHINTWSNTADSGNPNMFVPCIEYWVGSENKLENKVMTATIPGLNPGDKYSVTMYITVSKYNDAYSADAVTSPAGVSLQVGNGDVVNFSGTRINETRHFENTAFTAVGTVDASGNLIIKLNVSETNANWVYFRNVKYTYVGTPAVMVVNSTAKWGTFCAPFEVAIPDGVTAYTCASATEGKLNLEPVAPTIPANTPVILNAEEGLASTTFYGVKVPNATDDLITEGLLVGNVSSVAKDITDKEDGYLLQMQGGKTGFYKMNPSKTYSVGYNRCYLKMAASNAREAFFFEDDATAISALEAAKAESGVLKDGKYLENGKIVIVKNGVKYSPMVKSLNNPSGMKKIYIKPENTVLTLNIEGLICLSANSEVEATEDGGEGNGSGLARETIKIPGAWEEW